MAQGRSTKIITMIKWMRTIRLSIKNSLSRFSEALRLSKQASSAVAGAERERERERERHTKTDR